MRRAVPWLVAAGAASLLAGCAGTSGTSGTSSAPGPSATVAAAAPAGTSAGPGAAMSFFVTSTGSGRGGDLGGIAGADQLCQRLAAAAGSAGKTWHAYLSAPASGSSPAVNARDRIGKGPWVNAKGVVVARNLEELHGNNNIDKETALDEKGNRVKVRPETPNQHDMLTGSNMDGTLSTEAPDTTCKGWTSSTDGSAIVGHMNRTGTNPDPVRNASWNSSHPTPGCSTEALARVGGGGLFYCFAVN